MSDLKLSEIYIYPIKSLGGISLQQAIVMPKGLQHDRRWMLVDEDGMFMTQRVYPELALFKVTADTDQLTIRYKQESTILPFNHSPFESPALVTIWDDRIAAFEVSTIQSSWFSDFLKMKCKLVYFPEENTRPVNPLYSVNNEQVSLADAYPFLIIGQSSLDDLNSRLEQPLPMNRFRPNFVFTGGEPCEEDAWRNFTIGSNRFVGVKPCARCVLTTVNQDTAEKGLEPLRTLATYRKRDNKILFGQNLVAIDHQVIAVGDKITLQ